MTFQRISFWFGCMYILGGILGFVPGFTVDHKLMGLFIVNTTHNLAHMSIGLVAICASVRNNTARFYLRAIGLFYITVAAIGFRTNIDYLLMPIKTPDNLIHLIVGLVTAYFGFIFKPRAIQHNNTVEHSERS